MWRGRVNQSVGAFVSTKDNWSSDKLIRARLLSPRAARSDFCSSDPLSHRVGAASRSCLMRIGKGKEGALAPLRPNCLFDRASPFFSLFPPMERISFFFFFLNKSSGNTGYDFESTGGNPVCRVIAVKRRATLGFPPMIFFSNSSIDSKEFAFIRRLSAKFQHESIRIEYYGSLFVY